MRSIISVSFTIFILSAIVTGCASSKNGSKKTAAQVGETVLYAEALRALNDRSFTIEAEEYYFPANTPKRDRGIPTSGHISLDGNHWISEFTPYYGPHPASQLYEMNIDTPRAEMKNEGIDSNGNHRYELTVPGNSSLYKTYSVSVILFKDTNKCDVQFRYRSGEFFAGFRGYVYPL